MTLDRSTKVWDVFARYALSPSLVPLIGNAAANELECIEEMMAHFEEKGFDGAGNAQYAANSGAFDLAYVSRPGFRAVTGKMLCGAWTKIRTM